MRRRQRKRIVSIVLLLSFGMVIAFGLFSSGMRDAGKTDSITKITYPNNHFIKKKVKTILHWTSFFTDGHLDREKRCLQTCPAKCIITDDKSSLQFADAIEFHISNLWTKVWSVGTKSIIEFPKFRQPNQVWILSNMEPPPHLWGDIEIFNGVFNWTKWYRLDADILWAYGSKHVLNNVETQVQQNLKKRNYFKEKSKEAMIRISNCFDPGQRYKIIAKMGKILKIDKYGECFNNKCGSSRDPGDTSCDKIMKQYKFYLAFENDNCKDYITEKYWFSLKRGQIPVVNWKNYNKSIVIPSSFINIYDFDSIEDCARYIKKVGEDETLYNRYFDYENRYSVEPDNSESCVTCALCKALHDEQRPAQTYVNIDRWVRDDTCSKVEVWNNFMKNFHGWMFTLFGI